VSFYIGISGWRYAPWRTTFYPQGWPQRRELEYAASQVNSIEINGSFYSLQRPSSYQAWRDQTPNGFIFSVKGGRFITHMKRLNNIEGPLANFFASGVLALNEKLGPILWQLPPQFAYNQTKLSAFFELLPRTTKAAAKLASHHDGSLKRPPWTDIDRDRPLRHALEVRHPSFLSKDFVKLLRDHQIALVVADTAGKWPFMEDVTADFVYIRLHGDSQLYVSGYSDTALTTWARKIQAWSNGGHPPSARLASEKAKSTSADRDVYVYFDNDVKTHAPYDAIMLAHKLKLCDAPARKPPRLDAVPEEPRVIWPAMGRAGRDLSVGAPKQKRRGRVDPLGQKSKDRVK
jgi:uncharacterized protein YecE (DUF72 family)